MEPVSITKALAFLQDKKQVTTGQSLTVEQAAEQSRAMAQELVQEGAVSKMAGAKPEG